MKKSQSAFEFVALLCFVVFFFLLFYTAIEANISDKIREQNRLVIKDLALSIKNEIDIAYLANNGYTREFNIPLQLGGQSYSANLTSGMIFVKTDRDSLALAVAKINGSLVQGRNVIQKENNEVYLNR